MTKKG